MAHENVRGIRRLFNALRFSLQGLISCYRMEEAFRQEVLMLVPLLPLAIWLGENAMERALLVMVLLLVPIVELLNSAIETTVDRIGPEHHELSGRAKDIASAAVFLSLILAASVWAIILLPRII